jgi:16S rRNA (cytosine1402-N4)-methyltransferase
MRQAAGDLGWLNVQGVLLDLGVSSMQLDDPGRGFSFREDGPLDMRFDPTQGVSAQDLIDGMTEDELAEVISRYGEEPRARRIARAIVSARPVLGTLALAGVILKAAGHARRSIHPATRTFQALRIEVNHELAELEKGLEEAIEVLVKGGRLVVIAFHSLEDRIVKHLMVRESRDCLCPPEAVVCTCGHRARLRLLTRRPARPDEEEIRRNPRARSARLRAAERL